MATSLEKSKKLNEVNKPLHPSTNPEILVKIGLKSAVNEPNLAKCLHNVEK